MHTSNGWNYVSDMDTDLIAETVDGEQVRDIHSAVAEMDIKDSHKELFLDYYLKGINKVKLSEKYDISRNTVASLIKKITNDVVEQLKDRKYE